MLLMFCIRACMLSFVFFFSRRCIDCQCLDPRWSIRSYNYSYHVDFVADYITNQSCVVAFWED